ncbi:MULTISPECIES: hypothetical protein [Nonomuraea]|uniref:DUF4242 domain-containing protein n=1 Tax=Nonomuraea mangrovi TaxID=2316207 RepID=A0ABW4SNH2_9ACTN
MPHRAPPSLTRYLVEWYRPGLTDELLKETAHRIGSCAGELSAEGRTVDLLLTLFVPEDEVAFCLFAAGSPASVAQVCRQAEIPVHRLVEAIESATTGRCAEGGDVVDPLNEPHPKGRTT